MRHHSAFTLAELLIALAILGVIATFTIPKVLYAQQDSKLKAIGKETAAALSEAYQKALQEGKVTTATTANDLRDYFNYVKVDTASLVDGTDYPSTNCASETCLRLHNGAIVFYPTRSFAGTATTNAIPILIDADGKFTGAQDSLCIFIYYNGRVTSFGKIADNTCDSAWCHNAYPDPAWFSWD